MKPLRKLTKPYSSLGLAFGIEFIWLVLLAVSIYDAVSNPHVQSIIFVSFTVPLAILLTIAFYNTLKGKYRASSDDGSYWGAGSIKD